MQLSSLEGLSRDSAGAIIVILVPETPHRYGIYPLESATVLGKALKRKEIHSIKILSTDPKPVTPLDLTSMECGMRLSRSWG